MVTNDYYTLKTDPTGLNFTKEKRRRAYQALYSKFLTPKLWYCQHVDALMPVSALYESQRKA